MSGKRKTAPSVKYGEMKYFLVQFLRDNIKSIVTESQVKKDDSGLVKAMYLDKQYYSCLVLGESEDKDELVKMKNAMDAIRKKQPGGKKKENSMAVTNKNPRGKKKENSPARTNKQPGGKRKENSPAATKRKSKEEKQAANEEKEERKKEKLEKKKALDERDFNVLGQLSQLNKAVVVIDEQGREIKEKEKELERKNMELSRREKEVQRKEEASNKENRWSISTCRRTEDDLLFDRLRSFVSAGPSNRNEDEEEDASLNDSGLDLANDMANDIDVAEAANLISAVRPRIVTPSRPTVGMKRARSHASTPTANKCPRRQPDPDCSQCRHLAENSELREANALLTEQLTQCRLESVNAIQQSEAPRPGKVPKAIAEKHQMIELSPGKRVYVYESHITKAFSKKTATATACFLLSCFYKDEELIGTSLTGKNGKQCLDGDILESILSYTRKRFQGISSDSLIRIALRNKITCLEANAKKRVAVSSS